MDTVHCTSREERLMSELALIPPYSYLDDLRDRRLHMFLPTCLKSHCAPTYEKVAAQGWHVVLDNGMFEEGKPYPNSHLFHLAVKYGCREIVMPDVRNSTSGTLEAIGRFLHDYWEMLRYPENGVQDDPLMNLRFMAVVQGRNIKEQLELVKALGDLLPKDSLLGFPRRLTEESTSARLGIMEEVVSAYGMKY